MKNDILSALTNYGYGDLERCNTVLDEANVLDSDLAEEIQEMFGLERLDKIDLVACAYDYIMQIARTEIEQHTNKDIMNDSPYTEDEIYVVGNYLATSYDFRNNAEETKRLIKSIPEEKKSQTLKWFESIADDYFLIECDCGFDTSLPRRYFIGSMDGVPASISGILLGKKVAGVYNVGTLPEFRMRGLGTALTLACLHEARSEGYNVGVLQSSRMASSVYKKIGFHEDGVRTAYHYNV